MRSSSFFFLVVPARLTLRAASPGPVHGRHPVDGAADGGGEAQGGAQGKQEREEEDPRDPTALARSTQPSHFPFPQATKLVFRRLNQLASAATASSTSTTTTARIARRDFDALVAGAVGAARRPGGGNAATTTTFTPSTPLFSPADFSLACALVERRLPLVVLIAGTSGSGKSTLASLLAGRLGGAAVLSTDAVRSVLRGVGANRPGGGHPADVARLLAASTYEAGAVLEDDSPGGSDAPPFSRRAAATTTPCSPPSAPDVSSSASTSSTSTTAAKARAVRGWAAQADLVQPALRRAIAAAVARGEPVVVEGAHITVPWALKLMRELGGRAEGAGPAAQPTASPPPRALVIPFLAYISNASKHGDRLAVRAKYMVSSGPASNRYLRHLGSIRAIQAALLKSGAAAGVPGVDNTAVDRSVGAMHAAVLGCLRRAALGGESLVEDGEPPGGALACPAVAAEFAAATASLWSSKVALRLIRERVAARRRSAVGSGGLEAGLEGLRVGWDEAAGTPPAPPPHQPPPPAPFDAADFWRPPTSRSPSAAQIHTAAGSDGDDDGGPGAEDDDKHSSSSSGEDERAATGRSHHALFAAATASSGSALHARADVAASAFAAAAAASAAGASMSEGASDFYATAGERGGGGGVAAPAVSGGAFSSDEGGCGQGRLVGLPAVAE